MTLAVMTVLLCLGCENAAAQGSDYQAAPFDNQYHRSWTVRDGVPAGLSFIKQSTDGFLWLSSETGLYRFDGVEFVKYHPPAGQKLLNDGAVTALAPTPDGGLWIALRFGGTAFLRGNTVTNYSPKKELSQTIFALTVDRSGYVWGATSTGLVRFDGKEWSRVGKSWGVDLERVSHLRLDPEGTLWVDDSKTYYTLPRNGKLFQATGLPNGKLDIGRDQNGWLTKDNVGLFRLRHSDEEGWTEGKLMLPENISSILHGSDNSLWFGAHDGIWRINNSAAQSMTALPARVAQRFSKVDGLTDDFVYALTEDREGSIWAITPKGLDQFRRSAFTMTDLAPDMLRLVIVNEGDSLLVGSGFTAKTMLVRITNHGSEPIANPFRSIHAMFRDRDGVVWINADHKLWRFSDNKIIPTLSPQDEPTPHLTVQAMTQDGAGILWMSVATNDSNGVYRYDHGSWVPFQDHSNPSNPTPLSLTVDSRGHVWMGFTENRISVVDQNAVQHYSKESGLDAGAVTIMTEHGDHVWIGGTEGLDYFSNGRFQQIFSDKGTRLSGVTGIVETKGGDVWFSYADGVAKIDAAGVKAAVAPGSHRAGVRIFDHLDGYPATPIVRQQSSTVAQTGDGRIYFTAREGVAWIDPDHLEKNTVPPNVFVTGVTVDQHLYENPASLDLPKGAQNVQINYTATSYLVPARVQFRYKLEGFDNDWQEVGTRREAFYTRLPPGSYTFRVQASNNDGLWSTSDASWGFKLPPTFVQSIWLKIICVMVFALILTALYLLRVKRLTAEIRTTMFTRLAERERIARDLHDTFFQGIQGLFLRFNTGTSQLPPDEPARKIFVEALEQSDRVMLEGRELVLDLRADETATLDLAEALGRAGDEFMRQNKPDFKVVSVGQVRQLHPVCATEMFRIGREAIYNAFQHAHASAVEVEVLYEKDALKLRIRDDGQGVDERVLLEGRRPGHLGLPGMQERAQRMGANFSIWSKKDNGTEIEVTASAAVAYTELKVVTRPGWLFRWMQKIS